MRPQKSKYKFILRLLKQLNESASLAVVCVVAREGRQALLDSVRARADLLMLAVEKERMEIEFQRANNVVDLAEKVEKIKDRQLRERVTAAISSSGRSQPMPEMHGTSPGGPNSPVGHN